MRILPPLHPSNADFAAIRRRDGFYVDKTGLFRDLLEADPSPLSSPSLTSSHQFLARPRRFGKTLLINTLEAWFQGLVPGHRANPEGDTVHLDGMPAGWTSPAWLWAGLDAEDWHGTHGWHPVIRLDLSRAAASSPAGTRTALQAYLWDVIGEWYDRGLNWPPGVPGAAPPESPSDLLVALIRTLKNTHGRQPVVLVDEYDAPITEHLGTDVDPMPAVDELRRFFRVLKDDEGLLYGAFVTGITRFARRHLFSGANNFVDISDDPRYGALCGFTEEEVNRDLAPYRTALADREPRLDPLAIQTAWREQYSGYRFSEMPSTPRVYNPFTLIRGLEQTLDNEHLRDLAVQGRWPSAWSESGHPGLIARLAADGRRAPPSPGLTDLNRPDPIILMLETGYYTWRGAAGEPAHLDFPNREVAESWTYDILGLGELAPERDGRVFTELHTHLERGDVPGFAARLETCVFGFAHENLQAESNFRVLMQALFRQMAVPTQSEPSNWGGRADHEVRIGDRVYVFEVKYNRSADAALRQIGDRGYGRQHLDTGRTVTAVGLAFRRDLSTGPCVQVAQADLARLLAVDTESVPRERRRPYPPGRGRRLCGGPVGPHPAHKQKTPAPRTPH